MLSSHVYQNLFWVAKLLFIRIFDKSCYNPFFSENTNIMVPCPTQCPPNFLDWFYVTEGCYKFPPPFPSYDKLCKGWHIWRVNKNPTSIFSFKKPFVFSFFLRVGVLFWLASAKSGEKNPTPLEVFAKNPWILVITWCLNPNRFCANLHFFGPSLSFFAIPVVYITFTLLLLIVWNVNSHKLNIDLRILCIFVAFTRQNWALL